MEKIQPKYGRKEKSQNQFQATLRLFKKVAWTTKPLGGGVGGGQNLSGATTKKHFFYVRLPSSLRKNHKKVSEIE